MDSGEDGNIPTDVAMILHPWVNMQKHPIERAQEAFTALENALDDWTVMDDTTPQQEHFILHLLKRVQTLSQELAYELAEPEDYDSYIANREEWR